MRHERRPLPPRHGIHAALRCADHQPRRGLHPERGRLDQRRRRLHRARPAESALGIVGLGTAVAVVLDRLVRSGHLPLATLIARWSRDPARLLSLPGGTLSVGAPADITVLDLDADTTVDPARFHSRSRNTPFGGWQLRGGPWMTVVGGTIARVDPR